MDFYSRMVAWLKVLLPLTALGLLSTVFLLSRGSSIEATIPFAQGEVSERTRNQQVTAPFFSGVTTSGDQVMFAAAAALPGGPDRPAEARDLSARLSLASGGRITLAAETGAFALGQDQVQFTGAVRITSTTGYRIETEALTAALSGIDAETPGQVDGHGPLGKFTAGRMQIAAKTAGGPIHLRFNDGVKLVYLPENPEE